MNPGAGVEILAGYAHSLGLDMNRFNAEMADRIYTQRVQEHRRAGERSGLRVTPTFFLNGQSVDTSLGLEKLEHAVDVVLLALGRQDGTTGGVRGA
jgi:protein-disulfide isomerase